MPLLLIDALWLLHIVSAQRVLPGRASQTEKQNTQQTRNIGTRLTVCEATQFSRNPAKDYATYRHALLVSYWNLVL